MLDSNKILIEVLRQQSEHNIKATLLDLRVFNDVLINLIDSLSEAQITIGSWKEYFETHCFKFILLNGSLIRLFEGTPITHIKTKKTVSVYDVSSLYSLCRALTENYFFIKYLYLNPATNDHGQFRYLLYKYSGLTNRQKFDATYPETIRQKEEEKSLIHDLEMKIKENAYFKDLKEWKRKDILNNKRAKEIGWPEIINESNLNNTFYHSTWEYYSNYAHNEFIEALQLKNLLFEPKQLKINIYNTLLRPVLFTSLLISDLKEHYKTVEIIYNSLPEEQQIKINYWIRFGKNIRS